MKFFSYFFFISTYFQADEAILICQAILRYYNILSASFRARAIARHTCTLLFYFGLCRHMLVPTVPLPRRFPAPAPFTATIIDCASRLPRAMISAAAPSRCGKSRHHARLASAPPASHAYIFSAISEERKMLGRRLMGCRGGHKNADFCSMRARYFRCYVIGFLRHCLKNK